MYRILHIPFHAAQWPEYVSSGNSSLLAFRCLFGDDTQMTTSISWETLVQHYGQTHQLECIIVRMIGGIIMSDHQQNGLLMGWVPMVVRLMVTPSKLA